MTEAGIARTSPFEFEVEAGKKYAWCACGLSATQPLCDGGHKDTGFQPVVFKADKSETLYLCGCKRTDNRPHCDGSHNAL